MVIKLVELVKAEEIDRVKVANVELVLLLEDVFVEEALVEVIFAADETVSEEDVTFVDEDEAVFLAALVVEDVVFRFSCCFNRRLFFVGVFTMPT